MVYLILAVPRLLADPVRVLLEAQHRDESGKMGGPCVSSRIIFCSLKLCLIHVKASTFGGAGGELFVDRANICLVVYPG